MNSDVARALVNVKKGIGTKFPTKSGNLVIIEKVGVNKYKVRDREELKKTVKLDYSGVKELLSKLGSMHEVGA